MEEIQEISAISYVDSLIVIIIPTLTTGRVGGRQQRVDRRAEAAIHGVPRRRQEEEGRPALGGQLQDGQVKVAGQRCSHSPPPTH